ncbi:MAG: ATP-dependent helicase [Phycisphaerales bacterium]
MTNETIADNAICQPTQPNQDEIARFDIDTYTLTDDQKRAVVHDSGPVIVLAGPGTGKTRVITARVAYMILNRGVDPSQIAAVTFTNKAAGELRDRLGALIDPNAAAQVRASTFHSMGLAILRRFGDVLGLPSDPMLIDSSQRTTLIREIIREHRLYRYAMGCGIDNAIEQATKTMDQLRHLGMDSAHAAGWIAELRSKLLELEPEAAKAKKTELDRFEQGVEVYRHFESGCRDRGWIVFDDLIMLPSKLLKEHPNIASIVRQDHRHVVVDEFQDVNAAQIEMIRQLCPPASKPDLCVVGDDDQSIYGFRGADDRAFDHFARLYPGTPTITLSTNFRSAAPIVEASNAIIDRAMVRFDADKVAESFVGEVEGSCVELVRLEADRQAEEVIATMLLSMASDAKEAQANANADGSDADPFDFGKCAVIARTTNELQTIARVLMLEGIPVDMKEKLSPMDDEGVRDVMAWARLLIDPTSTVDLRRVLVRPPYRCDPEQVSRLIVRWKAATSHFTAKLEDADDPGALIDWIISQGDQATALRAKRVGALLAELSEIASQQPAAETIMEIIKRIGVVHSELGDGRARATRVRSIVALLGFARSRADRFDAPGDLGAMLRYWDDMDPNEKNLGELPEDQIQSDVGPTGDGIGGGVAMLTAHASKGLEYDTVFIPRVGQHGYPKTNVDDELLPAEMIERGQDPRDPKARKSDEERRVFYVALTRAKHRTILLSKVPKKPSGVSFVFELRDSLGEHLIERDVDEVLDPHNRSDAISRLGAEFKAMNRIRDVFDQARSDARGSAAAAMDAFELGDLDRDQLAEALTESANRIAIVRAVLEAGAMPQWVRDPEHRALAELLVDTLNEREVEDDGRLYPGLEGPLTLSFSQISSYIHCPRCYLVNYVLNLPSVEAAPTMLGTMVHEALEKFYRQWMNADAEGVPKPGQEQLDEYIVKEFHTRWPRDQEFDQDSFDQVRALGATLWENLHSDEAHIEELEREFVITYMPKDESIGLNHQLKAKLDRIDATDSGGRRVIDYKTGYPRKVLKDPAKTDLQMGIYAMALESFYGDPGPGSTCEYWLLQDGTKGVIGMDDLKMDKIREKIDKAIAGMLAGDWKQSSKCHNSQGTSPCEILDDINAQAQLAKFIQEQTTES